MKCDKEINDIEEKYMQSVRPHIKNRNLLILNVPQFWSTVLFNHPLLQSIFEPGEKDVIKYMASLDIEEDHKNPEMFKIHFLFGPNPYFENRVLVKTFTEEGSTSSTIKWKNEKNKFPKVSEHELWEHDELSMELKGFFRWFVDNREQFCDPIADLIRCQVWYDPLEYYYLDIDKEKSI